MSRRSSTASLEDEDGIDGPFERRMARVPRTRSTMPIANRPMHAIVPPATPAPMPWPVEVAAWVADGMERGVKVGADIGAPWDGVARPRTLTERIPLEKGWKL